MGNVYKVLEPVGRQMHMLHKHKDPNTVVAKRLLKTLHSRDLALLLDSIALDAFIGQNALFWCEPTGHSWIVGKKPCSDDGDNESEDALDDEEPSPAFETGCSV